MENYRNRNGNYLDPPLLLLYVPPSSMTMRVLNSILWNLRNTPMSSTVSSPGVWQDYKGKLSPHLCQEWVLVCWKFHWIFYFYFLNMTRIVSRYYSLLKHMEFFFGWETRHSFQLTKPIKLACTNWRISSGTSSIQTFKSCVEIALLAKLWATLFPIRPTLLKLQREKNTS